MSDGPWSPEHIYQEIVGYGKTWHRGEQGKKEMGQEEQENKFSLKFFFFYPVEMYIWHLNLMRSVSTGIQYMRSNFSVMLHPRMSITFTPLKLKVNFQYPRHK